MEDKKIDEQTTVLRVKRGERIIASIKKYCQDNKIKGGFFYGIGAVDEVELAHYNVSTKKYSSKKFAHALEMTNITGNIGVFENDLVIHAHATFADHEMNCLGGHLVEAKVSGTAEIFLTLLPTLPKLYDSETGLKLFQL
jgi:hypothetical protein